jgi:hypothetical protein
MLQNRYDRPRLLMGLMPNLEKRAGIPYHLKRRYGSKDRGSEEKSPARWEKKKLASLPKDRPWYFVLSNRVTSGENSTCSTPGNGRVRRSA